MQFLPGMTIHFLFDVETVTGSYLPTFMTGTITDRPTVPCALRQIIPVEVVAHDGQRRVVYVNDDHVLTTENP